ncbi:glycine-rich RNA-binding protein 3, mitochondrial [Neodiprion lecontei]|uniref:Glycine-rich RNA-binding protein 3, mitochondrial n=1 Tax=Neodiprion lecontei TaxID=441921 RepID=A0ABM3FWG1_NEOLC|nr:glycine-rich RNA-binding protein 3, mitochondrial [Neodiprion lecontei]
MWKVRVLGLLVLGCCGVVFVSGESVQTEGATAANDGDMVTLSTELKPPPLPAAGEHRGIAYLVNLFAVRNKTTDTSEENGENTLVDNSPEIIGPLASVLLVVDEEDDEKVTSEDLAGNLGGNYATVKSSNSNEAPKGTEVRDVVGDKPKKTKKIRSKRTLYKKYGGYGGYPSGGGGGYGGYPSGGGGGYGGYPTGSYGGGGGYGAVGIPVFVVPVGVYGGGGGGGGRGKGHHGGGGGGGNYGGGGYYPVGGGRGGGSQASAQASAQSSSWSY